MTRKKKPDIARLLARVNKPSRYLGNEFNARCKNWDEAGFRVALVFPDLYEIGMSHHGLQILYAIINSREGLLADRVYAPDRDMEEQLRTHDTSIFAVESRRPLADFDMIGITLPYELCYTNILTILALAGIPFRSSERLEGHPYIIGGGSGSFNPEPVADFFDGVLLGDGEDAVIEITSVLHQAKKEKRARPAVLERLATITGVYVPSFFAPDYDGNGRLLEVTPLKQGYVKVERRILSDLEKMPASVMTPLVPLVRIVHDRLGIEVTRGCTRGCRFCQAGIIYRPVRERSAERVVESAEKGMTAGGFEELALLSLSTGDYSCLSPVLGRLMDRFVKEYVSVSMPSMRVGTLTPEIMNQIKRVRKTGFTLAPEAGTDRLRKVINKGITEEDLLATCRDANLLGWKLLKFYFMFGLPTETEEDVRAIAGLVHRAARTASDRRLRINVSVATFVPKPHTPFQWEKQISIDEAFARIDLLKKSLPKGNCKLKWHDPRQSFLEGVMSRGDRRLACVIERAYILGARLDAWSENYDLNTWQQAGMDCGIDLSSYLQHRDLGEILPWSHLDTGVDPEFLRAERERAKSGEYTPDCRVHACQNCGVCDFKKIKPLVQCKADKRAEKSDRTKTVVIPAVGPEKREAGNQAAGQPHCRYRLSYAKEGDIRFLSHLEVIQVFFQAFRRAGVRPHYSQGFNPVPKVSFSPALPVGTESLAEYLDVDLMAEIGNADEFLHQVNRQLPTGIRLLSVSETPDRKTDGTGKKLTCYIVSIGRPLLRGEQEKLADFMAGRSFTVTKIRKGKPRVLDFREQVTRLQVKEDDTLEMVLDSQEGRAGGKPAEIIGAVLGLDDEQCFAMRIVKTWSRSAG